ncbi:hypothetical protein JOB18_013509 [Solea senegalensis]|uniref:Secreted protein n=1 Tax=Solea senegalensis TaxID=28829 RepID=A0AAV6QB83_SOLSE|nr:hypothetical protein JOB18_013509 [Solea senegalensis]
MKRETAKPVHKKWQTLLLLHLLTRRPLPSSSRGQLAPSRARHPNQARRDLETTSPAWRVLAPTSQSSAHGKPLATWSSATWRNTELSRNPLVSLFRFPVPIGLCPEFVPLPQSLLFFTSPNDLL